jgi:DNA-binding MarR family transcriptional regulator
MALLFLSPIHRATRQIALHLEGACGPREVSPTEGHVLTYLLSYAPCPIGELHRVFGLKRSTLTSLLDRLDRRGLLRRRLQPGDRRSFLVELTDEGRELAGQVRRDVEDLEAAIRARVDDAALAGFQTVMDAIASVTGVSVRPPRQSADRALAEEKEE